MLIITFHNDSTGNETIGNYDVVVSVNKSPLYWTRVESHKRSDGWIPLLEALLKEVKRT